LSTNRHRAGLTALYLGIFATIWFSVPSAGPPLSTLLVVGSIASLVAAVLGGVVAVRAPKPPRDPAADRRYLAIFGAELLAAGLAAGILALSGAPAYIPVAVGAVVGLHFVPLAPVLHDPGLKVLGAAVCVVALAALIVGVASTVSPAQVVGTGTGLLLLAYAVVALLRARRTA
jgi:hypothetical protein